MIVDDIDVVKEINRTDSEWRQLLDESRYSVLRQKGTERAFTGNYLNHKAVGVYICGACGQDLFSSEAKYDSGSGWPSFYEPIRPETITEVEDHSIGMFRVEVICSACKSHLGHVFNDGPRETTGLRYCINSVSLDFKEN
jgi:peptide-methionine (R)-S-oxide reductase